MTDIEFDNILKEAIRLHFDGYIPETALDNTPHKFSARYRRKMSKLSKLSEQTIKVKKVSPKKLFIYITAAIIAACSATLCVSAVREAFINFVTKIYSTHMEVSSVSDPAPEDFRDIYEITADMNAFGSAEITEDIFEREYVYTNEHCTIYFRQYIKKYYDISENTESSVMMPIEINGHEGYYIDMGSKNAQKITWDNGDYVISVGAVYDDQFQLSKNELYDMAISVQKAEK